MNENTAPVAVALARIDDALEQISTDVTARLAQVRTDVSGLRAELTAEPATSSPVPNAAPAPAAAGPVRPPAPQPIPPAPQPMVHYATQAPPMAPYRAPYSPPTPASPQDRAKTIGRVLAAAGVAVTLTGVALLLVLAAQAGLLSPGIRVTGGGLLAAILFGVGVRVGTRPERRTGAAALVATGVAAALFDVLAATTVYHWLPVIGALILTALIAAGGLAVARLWNNQSLGVAVGVALIVFAPILTSGFDMTLIVFLLVYAAATLVVQYGRDWPAMYAINTAATAMVLLPPVIGAGFGGDVDATRFAIAVAAAVLLAPLSAVLLLRSSTGANRMVVAIFSVAPLFPLIVSQTVLGSTTAAIGLGLAAAGFAVLAVGGRAVTWLTAGERTVWFAAAAVTAVAAITIGGHGTGVTMLGLLGLALVLAVAVRFAGDLTDATRIAATVTTAAGMLALAAPATEQLFRAAALSEGMRVTVFFAALLAIGALVALAWTWIERDESARTPVVVIAGLASLALFNVACVAFGAMVTGGGDAGFRGGHMFATIGFVIAGATALLWARRLRGSARAVALTAGLVVIGVAVAKLFLFDLAALDGVFRVVAFIVAGLVLLGLGVAYAQSLPDDTDPADRTVPYAGHAPR
ncbi:MAG: DUF2339 domain-containing protein [Gordonia sp. (in: high G+C Gram-positive bacteria)]|uniref:DUF2339 domain-containing protein n=1 Tax=Gordonia sp. (in: high G+C Gram-positive bacteria) TaxID=84139 RepID=UPI0039E6C4E7